MATTNSILLYGAEIWADESQQVQEENGGDAALRCAEGCMRVPDGLGGGGRSDSRHDFDRPARTGTEADLR